MPHTILLVDDSPTLRRMAADALRRGGHTVLEAADGLEALRLADGRAIDLVVTDVNMPGMGGAELVACLRSTPRLRATPVVVLSAGGPGAEEHPVVGATGWVAKPFDPAHLLLVVQRLVN
ncbi:MAG: response regulator [Gemmataceae bacterium]|nr:response regulator [Gemmataceae bacterium]